MEDKTLPELHAELEKLDGEIAALQKKSASLGLYPYILKPKRRSVFRIFFECVLERALYIAAFLASAAAFYALVRWLGLTRFEEEILPRLCFYLFSALSAVALLGAFTNLCHSAALTAQDIVTQRNMLNRYDKSLAENEARLARERREKAELEERISGLTKARADLLKRIERQKAQ